MHMMPFQFSFAVVVVVYVFPNLQGSASVFHCQRILHVNSLALHIVLSCVFLTILGRCSKGAFGRKRAVPDKEEQAASRPD